MTLPVAGWYDDPADARLLRWWTGTEWSGATERRLPQAPAAPEVAAAPATPLPYGPASVTGAPAAPACAPASVSSPVGPPALPPFVQGDHPAGQDEAPITAPATPPAPAPNAPTPSAFKQLHQGNPLAFTGALVGAAALVFNPLGGPGLLALIFGIMGVVRAGALKRRGAAVTGIGWAVAALVLAGIVIVRALVNLFGMAV
jgi:hypothetical protein